MPPEQVRQVLLSMRDGQYGAFQSKLIPNVPPQRMIGVRIPHIREFAAGLFRQGGFEAFLDEVPHFYIEENLLHAFLIEPIPSFDECLLRTERFLPQVDNWVVCDSLSPKAFARNKGRLLPKIREWLRSERDFTARFGLEMLMRHFLDDDFSPEYLGLAASVREGGYYLDTMVAWFFATALAKQYGAALPYVAQGRLSPKRHARTIRKAVESLRIPDDHKDALRALR